MNKSTTTTAESTATSQPATTDEPTLETVCEQLDQLTDRVAELEAELEAKDERIDELEAQLTEYKRFAGSEFANVRGRITDVEAQAQALESSTDTTTSEDADETLHKLRRRPWNGSVRFPNRSLTGS